MRGRQRGVKTIASKDASSAKQRGAFVAPLDGPHGLVCNPADGGTQLVAKAEFALVGLGGLMAAGSERLFCRATLGGSMSWNVRTVPRLRLATRSNMESALSFSGW